MRRLRVLLVVLAPIAAVLAYFTLVHWPREREALHAQNQRSLSALATRIEGQLSHLPQVAHDALGYTSGASDCDPERFLEAFPGVTWSGSLDPSGGPECAVRSIPVQATSVPGHLKLELGKSRSDEPWAEFDVDLRRMLGETMRRFAFPFDSLVVRNEEGDVEVVFPAGAPTPTAWNARPEALPAAADAEEAKDEARSTRPLGLTQVGPAAFWQYQQSVLPMLSTSADSKALRWTLVGLVRQTSFDAQARQVPLGAVAAVLGLLVLVLVLSPLLKLHLGGAREGFRQRDAHWALLALLVASSGVTLFVATMATRAELRSRTMAFTKRAAADLAERTREDLEEVGYDLSAFCQGAEMPVEEGQGALKCSRENVAFLTVIHASGKQASKFSPCMRDVCGYTHTRNCKSSSYVEEGPDSPQVGALLQVGERRYVEEVRAGLFNASLGSLGEEEDAHLDVVRGRVNDFALATLTMPWMPGSVALATSPLVQIGFRPAQFPVRLKLAQGKERPDPPTENRSEHDPAGLGVEQMIVDRDGLVKFHSNPARELQEDLFAETDARELRAAVASPRAVTLSGVHYHREPHVVSKHRIDGTPWSAVVMADERVEATAGMLPLARGSLGTAWLLLALLVTSVGLLAAGGAGNGGGWLWPRSGSRGSYIVAYVACALLAVGLFRMPVSQSRGWWVFALPVACLLGTFLLLASERISWMRRACVWWVGLCVLAGPVLWLWREMEDPRTAVPWEALAAWVGIAVWTALPTFRKWLRWFDLGKPPRNSHWEARASRALHKICDYPTKTPHGVKDAVVLTYPDFVRYWCMGALVLVAAVVLPTWQMYADSRARYERNLPAWLGPVAGEAEDSVVPLPDELRLVPSTAPYAAYLHEGWKRDEAGTGATLRGEEQESPPWTALGILSVLFSAALGLALLSWGLHGVITRLFGATYIFSDRLRARSYELGVDHSTEQGNVLHVGYGEPAKPSLDAICGGASSVLHDGSKLRADLWFDRFAQELVITNLQAVLWDPARRDQVLESLEAAVARGARIRIYCECDPLAYLREEHRWERIKASASDEREPGPPLGVTSLVLRRWGRVIASCRYSLADRDLPGELKEKLGPRTVLRDVLVRECGWCLALHDVALSIRDAHAKSPCLGRSCEWTRADVVALVERRASRIFQGVMDGCTRVERLTLARVAIEGFIQPNLWGSATFLEARGLLVRDDGLRVRGDAFRRYLRSDVDRADLANLERGRSGRWSLVRAPVVAVAGTGVTVLLLMAPDVGTLLAAGVAPVVAAVSGAHAILTAFGGGRLGGPRTA